jgi:hypothetical protein
MMGPISRFSRVITDDRLSNDHRHQLERDGLIVDIIKNRPEALLRLNSGRTLSSSEIILIPPLRVFTCLTYLKDVKLLLAI